MLRRLPRSRDELELVLEVSGFELVGSIGEAIFCPDAVHITKFHQSRTLSASAFGQEQARKDAARQKQDLGTLQTWIQAEHARLLPPRQQVSFPTMPAPAERPVQVSRLQQEATTSSPPIVSSGDPPPAQPQPVRQKRTISQTSDSESETEDTTVPDVSRVTQERALNSKKDDHRQKRVKIAEPNGSAPIGVSTWVSSLFLSIDF